MKAEGCCVKSMVSGSLPRALAVVISNRARFEAVAKGDDAEDDESKRGLRRDGEVDSDGKGCIERNQAIQS